MAMHVAYVLRNDVFVEDLSSHQSFNVTTRNSPDVINGTFDWVYEEEFCLRDGYRCSPDGKSIAYWQLDTSGVREFPLVNNTDSLYPKVTPIKYPKVGEKNAAVPRWGRAASGGDHAMARACPAIPREHYIAFMEWAGNSDQIVLQQLNRLQNTVRVMSGRRAHRQDQNDLDRSRRGLG